jgi:hypothetical protein
MILVDHQEYAALSLSRHTQLSIIAPALGDELAGEMGGERSFSDAAFLIEQGNDHRVCRALRDLSTGVSEGLLDKEFGTNSWLDKLRRAQAFARARFFGSSCA